MLKFIYGRAGSGKSYNIINRITVDAKAGKKAVLLVPEQFTFQSERALLEALGDRAGTDVSVISFTRMYDEITRKAGGRVANNITDSDRVILMNRALSGVKDKLKLWDKYVGSVRFTGNIITAVTEFKTAAISPEEILAAAEGIESAYLKAKLEDISVIFSAYNALLGNAFLDPTDDLSRLNDKLLDYKLFEGKNVYIDSFKNFTGQQYKIIERIVSQADEVTFAVTTDDLESAELSVFSNVNKTVKRICDIANKYSVKIDEPQKLTDNFYKSSGIKALERYVSLGGEMSATEGLSIVKCESYSDEAEFIAKTIRRLVREEGYRYRDFVIIARNDELYQKYIEKHCADNGVFCFTDKRKKIVHQPLFAFINSALSLAHSLSTDEIYNFHKTSLTDMSVDELAELENYTYLWNVKGGDWVNDFTMNPEGFVASDEQTENEAATEKLNRLNSLRSKAIKPILSFSKRFSGTPKEMSQAIVKLLEECRVAEHLKVRLQECENGSLHTEADELRQSWDAAMEQLDSMVKCLPNSEFSASDYIELWKNSIEFISVGNIPQTVDEVTFGSADRIKPSRPKIAFVMGVNQGVFPAKIAASGVFAGNERETLIKSGLEIPDYGMTSVIDEEYLLYTSLCCATQQLYITYSAADNSGMALEPSQIISELAEKCPNISKRVYNSKQFSGDCLPETLTTLKNSMFRSFAYDKEAFLTLKEALGDREILNIAETVKDFSKQDAEVSKENAFRLFGDKINISATGFDTFHRCRFSYFCRYGLGLKKIQPAEFDVLQRGTLSHYVLENLVKRYLGEFSVYTREKSDARVDELVSEYLSLIDGYERIVTPRIEFIVKLISASLKDVAAHIVNEMAQSKFRPEFFELKIGKEGTISTVKVPFSESGEMQLRGSIDRVDIYSDFVRIVDYKTGTKVFKLPDILVGLNLQMLIYLYTVVKGDNNYLNSKSPAGILYMPSKRDFGDPKKLSMNGLVLLDKDVIEAMDKEGTGEFIPKRPFKADGSTDARSTSFAEPAIFEETFKYIELLLSKMGKGIQSGKFGADPMDGIDSNACKYCDFAAICCFENAEHKSAEKGLSNAAVLEKLKEANGSGI